MVLYLKFLYRIFHNTSLLLKNFSRGGKVLKGRTCLSFGTGQVRFKSWLCLWGLGQITSVSLSFHICKMVLLAPYSSWLV